MFMPVTVREATPGLLPVKEAGLKPLATTTWAAVADFTSTELKLDAGSLHICRELMSSAHIIPAASRVEWQQRACQKLSS